MNMLRYYCQKSGDEEILNLLQQIKDKHQIPYEIMDLSTNGEYNREKEKAAYERDFKPRAKALKKVTGKSITELRSQSGNYCVSLPGTIGLIKDGQIAWWTYIENDIKDSLRDILQTGSLPV